MLNLFRLSLTSLLVWSISCGSDESTTTSTGSPDNPNANNTQEPTNSSGRNEPTNPSNPNAANTNGSEGSVTTDEGDAQLADIKAQMDDPDRPDALKPLALPGGEKDNRLTDAPEGSANEMGAQAIRESECEVHLKEIQEAQNNSGYEPAPINNWTPDETPTATARAWSPPMEFEDTWSTAEPLFGSYKVTVNGDLYTAYCKEDLDGDGTPATWEIDKTGEPKKTSAEGTH